MKKLINTEGELKKSVAYEKACSTVTAGSVVNFNYNTDTIM